MKHSVSIKRQIAITLSIIVICAACNQAKTEVSSPEADLNNNTGNVVNLEGLYRLQPEDKSLAVDIKVEFKGDNNSDWITNIDGNVDRIPKKYRIIGDALYVTHDLEEFNRVIEEQRKKGQELTADIAEAMISKIPAIDKYRIELTKSDTIKLFGSRLNFDLIKVE